MPTLRSLNGDFESMPASFGRPEHPLADDVAHHLVAAAGDAHAGRAEHDLAPRVRAPLAGVGDQLRAEHRATTKSPIAATVSVPASLAMLISGPGSWPAWILSIARWLVYVGDPRLDDQVGELLAHERIVGEPEVRPSR